MIITIVSELMFKLLWTKTYTIKWPKPLLVEPINTDVWVFRLCPRLHRFKTESRKPVVMFGEFMRCLNKYREGVGA